MVVYWSRRACPEALKVAIEIDQQAQSDGLSKIKAVNNDPVELDDYSNLNYTTNCHNNFRKELKG